MIESGQLETRTKDITNPRAVGFHRLQVVTEFENEKVYRPSDPRRPALNSRERAASRA